MGLNISPHVYYTALGPQQAFYYWLQWEENLTYSLPSILN